MGRSLRYKFTIRELRYDEIFVFYTSNNFGKDSHELCYLLKHQSYKSYKINDFDMNLKKYSNLFLISMVFFIEKSFELLPSYGFIH